MPDTTDDKHTRLSTARTRRAFWTLATTAFRTSPALAFTTLVLVPIGQVQFALGAYWAKLLADAVFRHDSSAAWVAAGLLATSSAIGILVGVGGAKLRLTLQERVSFALDHRITELAAFLPGLEHQERPEYLDKMELLRQQRTVLGQAMGTLVNNLSTMLQLVVTLALIARLHPVLLLMPLAGIPPMLITPVQQRRWKRVEEQTAELDRVTNAFYALATTAAPGKEVRVFNLEDELTERYEAAWLASYTPQVRTMLRNNVEGTLAWLAPNLAVVAATVFIASRAARGLNTPGDVILVVGLAQQVTGRMASIVDMITWFMEQLRAVDRYLWLSDYAARFDRDDEPAPVPDRLTHGITFEGVSFSYPGADVPSLQDVDLHLPAGSVVALIGENGAGKTTLVKLLARFYEPTEGGVLVDGVPLAATDHAAWRTRVAAGFQDFCRFELLVHETVGVGLLESIDDPDAVTAALGRAGATDVIERLHDGLATQLGRQWDNGVDLSGGQWQKLALSRALMREDPLLLLLDEPTSALDAETEHALFERFADASRRNDNGQITVLVSHRFSTVRMADLIVVVDGGRIRELGTHDDLLAAGDLYADLYGIQASAYR
jgi:ATP-binding cassette subfamily B protein